MKININVVKDLLANNPSKALLLELATDSRAGVQKLLQAYYKRQEKLAAEQARFAAMLEHEQQAYASGAAFVAGVDEAGRGPLAGPLVVAAVVLPQQVFIAGLNDSKQLSAAKRAALYDEILAKALDIRINIVSVSNIDSKNIYQATKEAMHQCLQALELRPQVALIDAMPVECEGMDIHPLIHGDALSASIAAASIMAKVTRDRIMEHLDTIYPDYGFASNKGYGSASHMAALKERGATHWHRRSYEPVKSMGLEPVAVQENIIYNPQSSSFVYEPKA